MKNRWRKISNKISDSSTRRQVCQVAQSRHPRQFGQSGVRCSDRRWKTFRTDPARIFERLEYYLKLVKVQLNFSIGKDLIALDAACINPTHRFKDIEKRNALE